MILAEYDVISYGNEQYVMLDRKSTQITIDISVRTSLGDNFYIDFTHKIANGFQLLKACFFLLHQIKNLEN